MSWRRSRAGIGVAVAPTACHRVAPARAARPATRPCFRIEALITHAIYLICSATTMWLSLPAVVLAGASLAPAYRTHNDRLTVPRYSSPAEWQRRAAYLREHILASAGNS